MRTLFDPAKAPLVRAAVAVAGSEIDQTWHGNPLRIFSPVDIRGLT
jgi:hypothetical protein